MTKDSRHDDRDDKRVWSKIDLVKLSAGTLAAISSAVCASWLGVTGTIVGAALASVIATIGQELYAHSLKHAHKRLQGVRLEQALAAVGATGSPPAWLARAGPASAPAPAPASRESEETVSLDDSGAAMASAGLGGSPSADSRDSATGGAFAVRDRRAASRGSSDDAPSDAPAFGTSASGGVILGGAASERAAADPADSDRAGSDRTDGDVPASADPRSRFAAEPGDDEPDGLGNRAHWVRLGLATAAMFVFAMLAITAFELLAGDSLAGLFGDDSAGATTLFDNGIGGGDPEPTITPVPPIETLPADPATTAPADTPQSTAPAETPAATDPAPTTGTEPQPELTGDPAAPPGDAEAPADNAAPAPAIGDGPVG